MYVRVCARTDRADKIKADRLLVSLVGGFTLHGVRCVCPVSSLEDFNLYYMVIIIKKTYNLY